jgi:hypothetical protein
MSDEPRHRTQSPQTLYDREGRFSRDLLRIGAASRIFSHATLEPDLSCCVKAEAGATAIIQPGGSIRDGEVVKAADGAGLAMVFTGVRHFRH